MSMQAFTLSNAEIASLIDERISIAGNIGNLLSLAQQRLNLFWVGLYVPVKGGMGLSHFQGLPACTFLRSGHGVCNAAAERKQIVSVPNVDQFPGYIACHAQVKSELVIPSFDENGECKFVLDADAAVPEYFTPEIARILVNLADQIALLMPASDGDESVAKNL